MAFGNRLPLSSLNALLAPHRILVEDIFNGPVAHHLGSLLISQYRRLGRVMLVLLLQASSRLLSLAALAALGALLPVQEDLA